jgi:apolipoprotein N-acyltransferase
MASGGLLWLCYFPAACGWLAWVALVPLLCLVRMPRRRLLYLAAYAGGLAFYLPAMQWMRVADPRMYATWIGLAVYCSLYFPLAIYLLRVLDRHTRLPLTVTVPVVWMALELLRTNFGGGFGWYLLGHSQHDRLAVIQVADLAGAYGVSFLVAAVNGLLFELLYGGRWFRGRVTGPEAPPRAGRAALALQAMAVAALLGGSIGYGAWRLRKDVFEAGPRVALVQGNLDQRIRNRAATDREVSVQMLDHYWNLSNLAQTQRPDLIVWPETSYPYFWTEEASGRPTPGTEAMARRLAGWQTPILVGLNADTLSTEHSARRYNSAVLVGTDGMAHGRYDKVHRVPFGEYVPFRDWLPFMDRFAPYDFDYSVMPGERFTRFAVAGGNHGATFGVVICYEDTDPGVCRPYAGGDGGLPADFVLNISNDGWFDGTSEHNEHLAICRFRAVENRRAVGRSVNMGISAMIDSNGRVLAPRPLPVPAGTMPPDARLWEVAAVPGAAGLPVGQWDEYKKVPGVLVAVVPLDDRISVYACLGDWLPWGCWVVVAGGIVSAVAARRRRAAV